MFLAGLDERRVVALGGLQAGVSQRNRDLIDGHTGQQELDGEDVPQHVRLGALAQFRPLEKPLQACATTLFPTPELLVVVPAHQWNAGPDLGNGVVLDLRAPLGIHRLRDPEDPQVQR